MGGSSSKGSIRRQASSYEYGGSSSSWDNNNSNTNYGGGGYPPQSPYPQQNPYQTPQHHLASASAPFYEYSQPKRKLDRRYSRIADNYRSLDEVIWLD